MSELALGWATYNGDHMSMYGVNVGVPKTLVRHLVAYCANTCSESEKVLQEVLLDVLDTPVSPELLPPEDGKISQKTEDLVGPYELHDFFLYDWRTGTDHEGAHAFTHPETALSNAIEHFEINEKEADIILNHMWPLTITKMPSCKESFLVSAMDKYCSLKENFNRVKKVKWIPQFAK